jgi:hypothetical protein
MTRTRVSLLVVFCLVVLAALALITRAGVTIVAKNGSQVEVTDFTIQYEKGKLDIGSLKVAQVKSARLGKIGEGATFKIMFRQNGKFVCSSSNVYFGGVRLSTQIELDVLPESRVRLLRDGEPVALQQCVAD